MQDPHPKTLGNTQGEPRLLHAVLELLLDLRFWRAAIAIASAIREAINHSATSRDAARKENDP